MQCICYIEKPFAHVDQLLAALEDVSLEANIQVTSHLGPEAEPGL
jgi:hypothetical protein